MRAADGTGPRARQASGAARAAIAYLLVGSLAGVNAAITAYPVFAAQALRYTLATAVLWGACGLQRRRGRLPPRAGRVTPRQLALLAALATAGVTGFNYCAAEAVRWTGAATTGTVIGAVPVVLAVAGPLAARRRPAARVLIAAILVAAGAAVVTGLGGTNLPGLLLACGALAAEACFTLLAVPLLPAFGPVRLSAYVTGLSVPVLFGLGFATGGRDGAGRVVRGPGAVRGDGRGDPARRGNDPAGRRCRGDAGRRRGGGRDRGEGAPRARAGQTRRGRRTRRHAEREHSGRRWIRRRRRSSAGRGRGHRVLSTHRADGGTARRGAAA